MKKILLSLMALMAITSVSSQTLQQKSDEATALMQARKYAEAAEIFDAVVKEGMDSDAGSAVVAAAKVYQIKCYYNMGGLAAKAKDYETSREAFMKAAEFAEFYDDVAMMNNANTWVGRTYELQGAESFNVQKYSAALPIFEEGYASDPRNAKMATYLGVCYCETGNFEKGFQLFDKVIAVGTKNTKYADEAAAAKQYSANYKINQLAKYQEAKNYDGVITVTDAILASDSKNAAAAKARLQAYLDKKAYAKVFELASSAAAVQTSADEKSNVYFILGAAYNALEKKDEAIAAFQKVTSGSNVAAAKDTITQLTTPAK